MRGGPGGRGGGGGAARGLLRSRGAWAGRAATAEERLRHSAAAPLLRRKELVPVPPRGAESPHGRPPEGASRACRSAALT